MVFLPSAIHQVVATETQGMATAAILSRIVGLPVTLYGFGAERWSSNLPGAVIDDLPIPLVFTVIGNFRTIFFIQWPEGQDIFCIRRFECLLFIPGLYLYCIQRPILNNGHGKVAI